MYKSDYFYRLYDQLSLKEFFQRINTILTLKVKDCFFA